MKIALCIPCYGDPKAKFVHSLAGMLTHFMSANIVDGEGSAIEREVKTFIVSCSMLTESRHRLVAEALAWGADYMLWMDADHVFPADALARLLAHGLPIVGVNYARRAHPTGPTAAKGDELVYTTKEKAEAGEVEVVDHLGLGLCLMDMRVFDVLQHHAENEGKKSFLPLFMFETDENGFGAIGEDVYFFKKLRAAGIEAHCDHGLSWEVGHCADQILTNAHALVQRDRWKDVQANRGKKFLDAAEKLEAA